MAAVLLVAAVHSWAYLGVKSLLPIGALIGFIALNPFVFLPPPRRSAWATRAVLGQRAWRSVRRWDLPSLYRIASATAYLVALSVALEGMLAEAIVMALVALGCKLLYLDWMARFYNRTVVSQ